LNVKKILVNNARNMEKVIQLMYQSISADYNIYDSLHNINCPTLIIHGRHDPSPFEGAEKNK